MRDLIEKLKKQNERFVIELQDKNVAGVFHYTFDDPIFNLEARNMSGSSASVKAQCTCCSEKFK